ncbi:MAG: two-component sensor histidine kinase, partial [Pseudonocardiales bacterium]|nr:two-component sensor histidine kinase [Pseudonocardiales bacterium]
MPLRLRLAMLFALGTAVVLAAAALAFVLQLRVSLDASVDAGLRTRVRAVADELASEGTLPQLGPTAQIVQLRAPDGRLLASSPVAGTQSLLDATQRQRALAGQVSFTTTVSGARSRLLATTVPVGGQRVLVVVGTASDVSDAAVDRVETALVVGGPPAVLLAGTGAWLL